jgi:hypothetical protein
MTVYVDHLEADIGTRCDDRVAIRDATTWDQFDGDVVIRCVH